MSGELATGLKIAFGQYVHGVGLICGRYQPVAAACPSGQVWRESFEGDAVCVTPDARFRKADGTCRSGYVWRNSFSGDNVCVTVAERDAPKKPVKSTGKRKINDGNASAGTQTPALKYVTVNQGVDIYRAPGGNDADKTGTTLEAGTQAVTLVESQTPWYHVNWPAGDGWVYSGEGYVSLTLP